jgi:hypothetical protein
VPSIFISEFDFSLTDSANFVEVAFEVFGEDCNLTEQEYAMIYLDDQLAAEYFAVK